MTPVDVKRSDSIGSISEMKVILTRSAMPVQTLDYYFSRLYHFALCRRAKLRVQNAVVRRKDQSLWNSWSYVKQDTNVWGGELLMLF